MYFSFFLEKLTLSLIIRHYFARNIKLCRKKKKFVRKKHMSSEAHEKFLVYQKNGGDLINTQNAVITQ